MQTTFTDRREGEKGFTLVELAIVMLIIGLLIGGVLKGAELIGNAEIAATIAQLNNIEAATTGFRDKYDSFPGDMDVADTRIAGATATDATAGDDQINNAPGAAPGGATADGATFWNHLATAEFYQGEVSGALGATVETPVNGAFIGVGFTDGTAPNDGLGAYKAGHYLAVTGDDTGLMAPALRPDQAGRIDRKSDDGNPTTGGVLAAEDTEPCANAADTTLYDEASGVLACGLYRRFQS